MICTSPFVTDGGLFNCGKCQSCLAKIRRDWQIRLWNEYEIQRKAVVVTLTYRNDCLPANNSLCKRDIQLFIKRLRKSISDNKLGIKIKYYIAGEYGDLLGRPHYHAVIFGLEMKHKQLILDKWANGFIKLDVLSSAAINYVTKYIQKPTLMRGRSGKRIYEYQLKRVPPFRMMSQGIGINWFLKNIISCIRNKFIMWRGNKSPLPRAYRQRLFLSQDDYPHLKQRQESFLLQFFSKSMLTPLERLHYGKHPPDTLLKYRHVRENFKKYLKSVDNHNKLMYYEYT